MAYLSELREEERSCLKLKEEALNKLLTLLEKEVEKNKKIKSGKEVVEIAKKVAEAFSEKFPSPKDIFEGNARECKEFFDIFTEKELLTIRDFTKNLTLEIETATFEDAFFQYLGFIVELLKTKTQIKEGNREDYIEEINGAWDKFLNGYFKNLVYKDVEFRAKIATVRIKRKEEKLYSSDPLFLTYLIGFSPYGHIVETLEEGKLVEDVKQYLKSKILEKLKQQEDKEISRILGGSLAEDKLKKGEKIVNETIEGLFEAVDTILRSKINLELFKELLNLAKTELDDNFEKTIEVILNNLELLNELLEDDSAFWSEIVGVLPVGFFLEDKITDYLTEKNFWHFLYTYRVKINEISEGTAERFLKGKADKRSEYFLKMSKKLVQVLKNPEALKAEDINDLTTLSKAPLKLLFYYGNANRNLVKELYNLHNSVKEIKERYFESKDELTDIDLEVLKRIRELTRKTIKNTKEYKKFEDLYEEIANKLLEKFILNLPSHTLSFLVAVDFESLADDTAKIINGKEEAPKTRRFKGKVRLIHPSEDLENFEYILSVKTFARHFSLDLSREIAPKVGTLKPIKKLEGFFNLSAELSQTDFGRNFNKSTYKVGFALSFLILSLLIAKKSKGLFVGFSLPPHNSFRSFLYALTGAVAFAANSTRLTSVQSFNWNNISTINVKATSIHKGINFHINKRSNIKGKIENALSSAYSNLPFEIKGFPITRKVAILALSHPEKKDKQKRNILGEAYIFEPFTQKGKTLFEFQEITRVLRRTFFGSFAFIEEDKSSLIEDYKRTIKGFIERLKAAGVEKVYLIPPLPMYKGLSTREVLFKEIYFSEVIESFNEILPTKQIFSGYAVVYTPHLKNFRERISKFLKEKGINTKGLEGQPFAVNLFEGIEKIVNFEGLTPLAIPKFGIIPLFSMEENKKKKTLNHHAFIYYIPSPEVFGGLKPENIFITEEEKLQLVDLLGIIHLIQYQKWTKEGDKTFKRNPFYVFPIRRSGDKNIFTLTEFKVFFNSQEKPRLQTVSLSFNILNNLL